MGDMRPYLQSMLAHERAPDPQRTGHGLSAAPLYAAGCAEQERIVSQPRPRLFPLPADEQVQQR
jgi:hypothetical protein